ncbi:hypothetical protein OROMI_010964 [Orobanche minor]
MQITAKKKRNEDEDEEEVVPVVGASTSTSNAQLLPPNILVGPYREALIKEIGDYVGEIAAKRARIEVEALLQIHEEKMIATVGEYVVGRLAAMERTPDAVSQAPAREAVEQPTASVAEDTTGEANAAAATDGVAIPTIDKGEVTPPAQGILPGAVRAREAVEQPTIGKPTIEKPTGQEMHDPYDTQMIAMYDDVTPPAQSILPCSVGSSRHAPTMAAPLRTMTALAIPNVILNVRPVRRRFPAAVVRSPFLHDDIRGGDTFDHYLILEDGGMRNETVEEVFDVMHRGMREKFHRYDHNLFDPTIEEVIPIEEMDRLYLFAEAVQPNCGDNMKQWIQCDKLFRRHYMQLQ